jgi:PASTA domain
VTPPTRPWGTPAAGHGPIGQWGTGPTPPGPKPKRGSRILLAAAIGVVLLVATGFVANSATIDNGPPPTPPTTPSPGPADPPGDDQAPPSDPPKEDPQPEPAPEPERVEVPTLVGMTQAEAEQIVADLGLEATTKYKSTDQFPAEIVISQSHKAGAWVLPDTTVSLVVAKTPPAPPPPPPAPEPPPPPPRPAPDCDPSYPDVCLDPAVEDYDCASGSGNGPEYVEGPIRVLPPDPFDLDREGDGVGCQNG